MPKVLTPKQEKWAFEKWSQGYTQQEVADALFVSISTISKLLKYREKERPILEYDWNNDPTAKKPKKS